MDPVFTLQWPEFAVAHKLQKLLPRKDGYSVLVPLSRQEKGIDLAVLHRSGNGPSKTTTIQVKASRAYLPSGPTRKGAYRFQFGTWFSRFDVPDRADYVILFGMYPRDLGKTMRVSVSKLRRWYRDCSLLFTGEEMRTFLEDCKTLEGKPDRMFGFWFDEDLSEIVPNRGAMKRSGRNYADYLLKNRIAELKKM